MSTTPRSVIRPGKISAPDAAWNSTNFTKSSLEFGGEYSTSPRPRPAAAQRAYQVCDRAAKLPRRARCDIVAARRAESPYAQGKETSMAVIKVTDIAYVRLRSPDLDLQAEFLDNFGLYPSEKSAKAIYYRGTDP